MDFVVTADLDWASESCLEGFLALTDRFQARPTLFVTHASPVAQAAAAAGRAALAIHPNFRPGSSHGADIEAVLDHTLRLVPSARFSRSHHYLDSPAIQAALLARGITLDSNECRHLAGGLRPQVLPSGLRRFPVFFEDDVHWTQGHAWSFTTQATAFFSPGLKILNFHPFFVALNIPDAASYARHKPSVQSLTARQAVEWRHPGAGAGSFLVEALAAICAAGHRFVPLATLAEAG